jgi:hypothetical protein
MVSSTESVTNMTRGKTKAHEKSELKNYFNQPALSSKDDNVLQKAFNNTGKAGVKIAESAVGTLRRDSSSTSSRRNQHVDGAESQLRAGL